MDRIGAARERVSVVKSELRSPAAHSPCIKCRYWELACTHPAVIEAKVNPETGRLNVRHASAKEARSETGACGPEGALFDRRGPIGLAVVSVLSTTIGRWGAFIGLLTLGDYLLH